MIVLLSCQSTKGITNQEFATTPGVFAKAPFEAVTFSNRGTRVSIDGTLVSQQKLGQTTLSLVFHLVRNSTLGRLKTNCIVGVGETQMRIDYAPYWWSGDVAQFRRRDWVNLEEQTFGSGYFDPQRHLWISSPDGDPDTGYFEEELIESVSFSFEEKFEVFVPQSLLAPIKRGKGFWIRFTDGDDEFTFSPDEHLLEVTRDILHKKS